MAQGFREERLEDWMHDHGPAVLMTARRMLRTGGEAEDVFQEVFTRAYCRIQPFRDENHVRAWLLRVTINECRSRLRSAWRRRVVLDAAPEPVEEEESSNGELIHAVRKLPRRDREVVWLYHFAGFKTAEIAEMLSVPPATVRTRLSRARLKLRTVLTEGSGME